MISVAQMARIVHPSSTSKRGMAILTAYFDESGSPSDNQGAFVIGGYIAPEVEWGTFEKAWGALLKHPCRYPVTSSNTASICRPLEYLHATEMHGLGKKRFRSLGQRNRNYLVNSSIGIITNSNIIGLGSAVLLDAYNRLPQKAKSVIGDPYQLCFQHVIMEAASHARIFLGEDHQENIAFFFEKSPVWEIRLHEMYNQMIEEGFGKRYRMGPITFAEKADFYPLQAADRLAFESYKHFVEREEREEYRKLIERPQHFGRYFNEDGLQALLEELRYSGKI